MRSRKGLRAVKRRIISQTASKARAPGTGPARIGAGDAAAPIQLRSERDLWIDPFGGRIQLVERVDVRLGRGRDDVRIGSDAVDDPAGAGQSDRDPP